MRLERPFIGPITENEPSASQGKTLHGPIWIIGDASLDTFINKTGSGTEADPYIIEDLHIEASSTYALYIQSVLNRHLIIRNCYLAASGISNPVSISFSGNITLEGCELTVKDTVDENRMHGLFVYRTNESVFQNNLIHDLTNTKLDTLKGETHGITFSECHDNFVISNTITTITSMYYYSSGFYLEKCNSTYFSGNRMSNIRGVDSNGFYITSGCCNNTFVRNECRDLWCSRYYYGILCVASNSSIFESNVFTSATGTGTGFSIRIQGVSSGNVLKNNAFCMGDESVNDVSSGDGNTWYGSTRVGLTGQYRLAGNFYWNYTGTDANSDYIGDTQMWISGSAGEIDPYPLMYATMDNDLDGLYNAEEIDEGTDANEPDTDGDGLTDYEEVKIYGTNPLIDTITDSDADGLADYDETNTHKTDPGNPDTDGDGWTDYEEIKVYGSNPLARDSDGDGKDDPLDPTPNYADPLANAANTTVDTDADGLTDYEETAKYFTNPNLNDTDGDGWTDYDEIKKYGTNPLVQDTDGDGTIDSLDARPLHADIEDDTSGSVDYTNTILISAGIVGGGMLILAIALFVRGKRSGKSSGEPGKTSGKAGEDLKTSPKEPIPEKRK